MLLPLGKSWFIELNNLHMVRTSQLQNGKTIALLVVLPNWQGLRLYFQLK